MTGKILREQVFRTPVGLEKKLGLWVDRIGQQFQRGRTKLYKARILGLYSVVYIEKGEGLYVIGKQKPFRVLAGDVIVIKPKDPTIYYSMSGWMTKWIIWSGPEAYMLDKMGYLDNPVVHDVNQSADKAWTRLMQIRMNEDPTSFLERKNILQGMILELSRASNVHAPNPNASEAKIDKIVEEIKRNPHKKYSVTELAAECGSSISNFRKIFRARTGSSPMDIVSSMRISMAKRLLYDGKSIKETAELSGFDDIFYFMRAFKKMTGITAGKFRSRHLR